MHSKPLQKPLTAYQQKLLDPRWQRKRLEILQRDNWCCQVCFQDDITLHIHHRYYNQGKDPWDYPAKALVTLCEICHETETQYRRDDEALLLSALREVGFWHDDINNLACAFGASAQTFSPRATAYMLIWLLGQPGEMQAAMQRYLAWLQENGYRGTLQHVLDMPHPNPEGAPA